MKDVCRGCKKITNCKVWLDLMRENNHNDLKRGHYGRELLIWKIVADCPEREEERRKE